MMKKFLFVLLFMMSFLVSFNINQSWANDIWYRQHPGSGPSEVFCDRPDIEPDPADIGDPSNPVVEQPESPLFRLLPRPNETPQETAHWYCEGLKEIRDGFPYTIEFIRDLFH